MMGTRLINLNILQAFDQLLKEIKRSRENENKQRVYTESLETENLLQREQV